MEEVILVNEKDEVTGRMEKLEAHRKGFLHRAFSIFLFSPDGQWWIHRRAQSKYHSGGLWTNTCCGHPRPGEEVAVAAARRLFEECGLRTHIRKVFEFTYKAAVGAGLTEWELDHVFTGVTELNPVLNPIEAEEWKLLTEAELLYFLEKKPEDFTPWFKSCFFTQRGRLAP
ncbi:MAG: isopentenyl-diphosphate Delta-isomerase [Bacteroidia bacterium]|nr:isopentenyl-diphosphate Delta-isomerase [Bacteroidia bacterium]